MADSFVQLPDDSSNTGKKVRTQMRIVGSDTVHEHAFNIIDPLPAGDNNIGNVDVVSTSGLTDAQLRAAPVPVSGTVTATGPLTDSELRAAAVPVSGPLTDAQLRALPVPVSGNGEDGALPLHVDDPNGSGFGTLFVQGDPSGNALNVVLDRTGTVRLEATTDEIGPLINNNDLAESGLFESVQSGLSVCLKANGTLVAATVLLWVMDSQGDISALTTLTAADLNVLKRLAVCPYRRIRCKLISHTYGTATQLNIAITTSQISGGLTDTELRAAPVPVSGTVATGGLTDTELRAAPVPISGTVTASGPLTDTQLRATPVPVSAANLPLPTGAATETTLADAAASLSVLDDWDESDRAKVNPIAGQAGVQGGSGAVSALTQRVVLATDVALPTGTNNIGDVDVLTLPALPTGTNKIGTVAIVPATTGGLTPFHLESAATTNATVVKASAGQLFGWYIYNSNAAARKIAFHNTASTPTAGASIFFTIVIPPTSGANVFSETGIAFSSGIAITTVTGLADANSTAVAADDLNINLFYA